MRSSIGVAVATFGDGRWVDLALERALPSVQRQTIRPAHCVMSHGATLAAARNDAVEQLGTDFVIVLDADDELAPDYLENVARKLAMAPNADLLVPAVQYVHPEHSEEARMLGPYPLRDLNYIVVGAPVRRSYFERAGGFWEEPAWEDWSLWLRVSHLGATLVCAPRVVYRAFVSPSSRNRVANPHQLRSEILAAFDRWAIDHAR